VFLQLAAVYAPPLQPVFRTVALPGPTLGLCAAASAAVFLAIEGGKFARGLARKSSRA
jgi:hypothetical protein